MDLIILNDGLYQLMPVTKEIMEGIKEKKGSTLLDVNASFPIGSVKPAFKVVLGLSAELSNNKTLVLSSASDKPLSEPDDVS